MLLSFLFHFLLIVKDKFMDSRKLKELNKNRRRSSYFCEKFPTIIDEVETSHVDDRINSDSTHELKKNIISKHISSMKSEIDDWKNKMKSMELSYAKSKEQSKTNLIEINRVKKQLTTDERNFLDAKPDLMKTIKRLETIARKQRITEVLLEDLLHNAIENLSVLDKVDVYLKRNLFRYLLQLDECADIYISNL